MPATFTEERQLIEQEFLLNDIGVPVQFDNVAGLLFEGSLIQQDDVDEWIRLTILHFDNNPVSIGSFDCAADRIDGEVILSIFVRENQGSNRAREILDIVYSIYNRQIIGDILFRNSVVSEVPPTDGWYSIVVQTDFQYDKCLTTGV